jgi:hypothetical protein
MILKTKVTAFAGVREHVHFEGKLDGRFNFGRSDLMPAMLKFEPL